MEKRIMNVCGHSCTDCDHHGNECRGCRPTAGKPFWTTLMGADACPIYACCAVDRNLPHCGKCPELMCERFHRFRDPSMTDEQVAESLAGVERTLRAIR
ncbi:MAG TPA: DUF3795 domain-containing protein [Methanoregula sp.]|nr:DUF3795 domain-containing protein [Methanoregula sp.]